MNRLSCGLLGAALLLSGLALADASIVVDGNLADWPSPGFTFSDAQAEQPRPFCDIAQVRVTNDNTSASDGNLYIGVSFFSDFNPNLGSNDIDVWVYLDIDGDGQIGGTLDRWIELTDRGPAGGVFLCPTCRRRNCMRIAWSGNSPNARSFFTRMAMNIGCGTTRIIRPARSKVSTRRLSWS